MLDPTIVNFLTERKDEKLKKAIKAKTNDIEREKIEKEIHQQFKLENWLPNAARRAKNLSLTSHPGKFSHPSAKITPLIATKSYKADGFLRSGNAAAELDVLGASSLDVYTFLSLKLKDQQDILSHLENDTDYIKSQFSISGESYDDLKNNFLVIKTKPSALLKTSSKIKQVYFPIDNDYHLLSILTPSGLMFKLKERINALQFSDEAKQARENRRKQQFDAHGYSDIYNLTVIGFGGGQPQNISKLNSANHGEAYLLASLPPALDRKKIRTPYNDFFTDILFIDKLSHHFWDLHKLFKSPIDNKAIKLEIEQVISNVLQEIIEKTSYIRQFDEGWSETTRLAMPQKIWLDNAYLEQREKETEWLVDIIADFARWFSASYEQIIGKDKAIHLDDIELIHLLKKNAIKNKEGLL